MTPFTFSSSAGRLLLLSSPPKHINQSFDAATTPIGYLVKDSSHIRFSLSNVSRRPYRTPQFCPSTHTHTHTHTPTVTPCIITVQKTTATTAAAAAAAAAPSNHSSNVAVVVASMPHSRQSWLELQDGDGPTSSRNRSTTARQPRTPPPVWCAAPSRSWCALVRPVAEACVCVRPAGLSVRNSRYVGQQLYNRVNASIHPSRSIPSCVVTIHALFQGLLPPPEVCVKPC
jgi:hypothetical protein